MKKQETKLAPIAIDIDDVHVTLKSIERNKLYECKCESCHTTCDLKQKLATNPSPKHLVATEALLNVRNASTEAFPIETSCWELIDTDGFAYKALPMCDALRPPRSIDPNAHEHASPGTQVNVILLFPELERNTQIACLAYWRHRELYLLEINKSKRTALDMVNVRESLRIDARSARIENCKAYLEELQQTIQVGISKTLTRMESESFERKFKKLAEIIEQTLRRIKPRDRRPLETTLQVTMSEYQRALEDFKKRNEERKKGNQTLEGLRRLSPKEFEKFVEDLLAELGYEKTNQTGGSGDQGADILAEKNGDRVVIQCKRYKGIVGPHEVRDLIGAMALADAQRGLLITTGMFSIQAERMIGEAQIEMVDGNKLIEVIAEARTKRTRAEITR
ncbi:MAG TPA: restriction endonuclease [Pyrinomonadaceae bacterium]|nr:restriction endonuclease [Pyrinomonadaceae bacterium]